MIKSAYRLSGDQLYDHLRWFVEEIAKRENKSTLLVLTELFDPRHQRFFEDLFAEFGLPEPEFDATEVNHVACAYRAELQAMPEGADVEPRPKMEGLRPRDGKQELSAGKVWFASAMYPTTWKDPDRMGKEQQDAAEEEVVRKSQELVAAHERNTAIEYSKTASKAEAEVELRMKVADQSIVRALDSATEFVSMPRMGW